MKPVVVLPVLFVVLAACAPIEEPAVQPPAVAPEVEGAPPPPPANARTVEQFDTTTVEARNDAVTTETDGSLLGTEVASLGDPARPGFWLETPLVTGASQGRVVLPGSDTGVEVELLPSSGGSRLSLAALRVLGVPLTALPTVEVYEF